MFIFVYTTCKLDGATPMHWFIMAPYQATFWELRHLLSLWCTYIYQPTRWFKPWSFYPQKLGLSRLQPLKGSSFHHQKRSRKRRIARKVYSPPPKTKMTLVKSTIWRCISYFQMVIFQPVMWKFSGLYIWSGPLFFKEFPGPQAISTSTQEVQRLNFAPW